MPFAPNDASISTPNWNIRHIHWNCFSFFYISNCAKCVKCVRNEWPDTIIRAIKKTLMGYSYYIYYKSSRPNIRERKKSFKIGISPDRVFCFSLFHCLPYGAKHPKHTRNTLKNIRWMLLFYICLFQKMKTHGFCALSLPHDFQKMKIDTLLRQYVAAVVGTTDKFVAGESARTI